jgi:protein-tyrosine phosphatase
MTSHGPIRDELRVLVVCTANVSRSPLGAAFLSKRLVDAGVVASVRSAGVIRTRLPVDELSVVVGRARGVDIAEHRPRRLTTVLLAEEGTDLVIAMTRAHVREVVALDSSAWQRTFTLKELARLVRRERLAEVGDADVGDIGSWVVRFGADRTVQDLLGADERDDVGDPYGSSLAVHHDVATEIDQLVEEVVDGFLRFVATP